MIRVVRNLRLDFRFTAITNETLPKKKSKAIPLQAWRGPEGSRRLRLPDFNTVGT